jgi:hypothetical protein
MISSYFIKSGYAFYKIEEEGAVHINALVFGFDKDLKSIRWNLSISMRF